MVENGSKKITFRGCGIKMNGPSCITNFEVRKSIEIGTDDKFTNILFSWRMVRPLNHCVNVTRIFAIRIRIVMPICATSPPP